MNFSLRYYKTSTLIILILLLAIGIDLLFGLIEPLISRYFSAGIIRVPSNATIIGSLLYFHNKYLWNKWLGRFLVNIPDISGRYKGKIYFEFNGLKGQNDCIVEVTQTASSIKINSYFKNNDNETSTSKSLVENIIKEEDGCFGVYIFYLNTGSLENKILDCHQGANYMKFIPKSENYKKKLKGNYFTNRLKQTRGKIEVEYKEKKLKGEF